jgi:16S rRNA (adenine1518-N6/adenine1519-N6)-dimethyltransferase
LADIAGLEQAVWYAQVVKAAFGQRRKTLLNSLTGGLGRPRAEVEEVLKGEGIDTSRRAETLDPQELGGVARALAGKSGRF